MNITPLEIDQQQFQRAMRGYDPVEVHAFLELVSRQMESLIRENQQRTEALRLREEEIVEFRAHETLLREALVSAGRLTEEIKASARKEAELIRAEAELQAEKIVSSAQARVVRLSEDYQSLRRQKSRLVSELRAIVEGHGRLLDTQEELDREALDIGRL